MPTPSISADIVVDQYNLTLIWPLSIRPLEAGSTLHRSGAREWTDKARDLLDRQAHRGLSPWQPVADPLHHLRRDPAGHADEAERREEYAEFVYFFPFVQRFLYGKGPDAPMRLYRRTNLLEADVTVGHSGAKVSVSLSVARMNLYVFDSATAVLVTEFAADAPVETDAASGVRQPMTLATAQTLNDHLRRATPPFFINATTPGQTPLRMQWHGSPRTPTGPHRDIPFADYDAALDGRADAAGIPLLPWWSDLLPDVKAAGLRLDPVLDDRMPAVAFLAVDDPAALSDGDWMRLANFDAAGNTPFPYAEAFVNDALRRHAYDRFWDPGASHTDYRTRYLFSGFGSVTVARSGDWMTPHLRAHTRRHYFQMALVTQFQMAALLALSDRLAQVLRHDLETADARRGAERVLRDLLRFTNAYWFPDLSNQIQAREIFDLWRGHTEVHALHAQVLDEAREANAFLNRRADERAAESAARLNHIGAAGLAGALATGFMGMNQIVPEKTVDSWFVGSEWAALGLAFTAAVAFLLLGNTVLRGARRLTGLRTAAVVVLVAITTFFAAVAWGLI